MKLSQRPGSLQFICWLESNISTRIPISTLRNPITAPAITDYGDNNVIITSLLNDKEPPLSSTERISNMKTVAFEFDKVYDSNPDLMDLYNEMAEPYFKSSLYGNSSCILTFGPFK